MKYDVVSVGAATLDIFAKSQQFIIDKKLLSLEYSSKNEISQSLICSGGGATNSAVSFSRLGLKSACVALLGDDPLADIVKKDLKDNSVSTSYLKNIKGDSTDFSIILVAPDGARSILTNRGSSRLESKHFPWKKLKTSWLYITSLEGNLDLLEKLIGFAKESDIKVALNPGNRELARRKELLPLLPYVDFLLLNRHESEELVTLPLTHPLFWEKLLSFGASVTALTDGRNGAHILTESQSLFSPIINTKPADETGAGDAFGSTFVASLLHGRSLEKSLSWAIKNSASVVSHLGAKEGLLTLSKIKR